jgi:epoxyqueuosine reductase
MAYDPIMVGTQEQADAVRERARALGFDLVGFAEAGPFDRERELILGSLARGRLDGMAWITPARVRLSCDPEALLPGARTIVALGTAYPHPEPDQPASGSLVGRVARYARGRDYHDVIPPKLRALADELAARFGPETRSRVFVDTGPLVDRAATERAGLGFVGKNTCILTGSHGSYVFLSAILTTAALPPDSVAARDCGSCRACIDACPTGAIVAPGELDTRRCISYLTIEHRGPIPRELRPDIGDWVFGCDVCQEVCPWNRARPLGVHAEFAPAEGAGATLDLIDLLALDDAAFRARFRGTPLTRAKRRGLLRNAAVALGNARDPRAIPALAQALTDAEPLVRGHAAWALGQMGDLPASALAALERALAAEADPDVREDLLGAPRAGKASGEARLPAP